MGFRYLLASEVMPYHEEILGMAWRDLSDRTQVLLLALMRGAGAGAISVAGAMLVILAFPFRKGERWAVLAVPAIGLVGALPTLWISASLAVTTGVATPWAWVLVGSLLLGLGAILYRPSK